MPNEDLYIAGTLSYADLFELAEENKLDNATTNLLLEGLLQQNRGKTKRNFAYSTPFAATESDCAPVADRTFVHIDWIDGESVVQAEETSIEEGFNKRFHLIEDDIDSIHIDIAKLFECLSELRGSAAARFTEIMSAINATNGDVAECCKGDSGGGVSPWPGTIYPRDRYWPVEPYPFPGGGYPGVGGGGVGPYPLPGGGGWGGPMPYPGTGGGGLGPWVNPGSPWTNWGGPAGPRVYPQEVVTPWKDKTPIVTDNPNILRSTTDEDLAIIAGMQGRRIGLDEVNGKNVEIWSTPAGLVLTPTDKAPGTDVKVGWTNPHIGNAGEFIGWAGANERKIRQQFGGREFTMQDFGAAFGNEKLPSGVTVGAFVNQLPSGSKATSGKDVGALIVGRTRDNVVRDHSVDETVIGLVGMNAGNDPGAIPVTRLASVDAKTGEALAGIGIKSVKDLAQADPAKIDQTLKNLDDDIPLGTGAGFNAQAQILSGLLGGRPL